MEWLTLLGIPGVLTSVITFLVTFLVTRHFNKKDKNEADEKQEDKENDKTRENVGIIMEKVGSLEIVVNYLQKALQALLRDRIIQMYNYYYKDAGYIPMYARESLDHMYEEYKNLGGNGVIDSLVTKLKTLDIEPIDDSSEN